MTKQEKIIGALLSRSLAVLNESGLTYVIVLKDCPQILTNAEPRHAAAMLEDAAQLQQAIREKQIDRASDEATWGGNDESDTKHK